MAGASGIARTCFSLAKTTFCAWPIHYASCNKQWHRQNVSPCGGNHILRLAARPWTLQNDVVLSEPWFHLAETSILVSPVSHNGFWNDEGRHSATPWRQNDKMTSENKKITFRRRVPSSSLGGTHVFVKKRRCGYGFLRALLGFLFLGRQTSECFKT